MMPLALLSNWKLIGGVLLITSVTSGYFYVQHLRSSLSEAEVQLSVAEASVTELESRLDQQRELARLQALALSHHLRRLGEINEEYKQARRDLEKLREGDNEVDAYLRSPVPSGLREYAKKRGRASADSSEPVEALPNTND